MKKLILLMFITLLIACENESTVNQVEKNVAQNDPINETHSQEETGFDVEKSDTTFDVKVGVDVLNIRNEARFDSEVLGVLLIDTDLTVTETVLDDHDKLWYKIEFEDQIGYVASWFTVDYINYRSLRIHDERDDLIGFYSFDDISYENVQANFRVINHMLYREYEAKYKGLDVIAYREVYPIETLNNDTDKITFNTEVGIESMTINNPTIKIENISESTFFMEFVGLNDHVAYILSPKGLLYFENLYLLNTSRSYVFKPVDSSVAIYSINDHLTKTIDFSSKIKDAFIVGDDLFVTLIDGLQYLLHLDNNDWVMTKPDGNMNFVYSMVANTFLPKGYVDNKSLEGAIATAWYVVKDDDLLQVKSLNYNGLKHYIFMPIDTSVVHKLIDDIKIYHQGTVYKIPKGDHAAFYFNRIGHTKEQYILSFNYFESKTSDFYFLKHFYLNPKEIRVVELGNVYKTSSNNEMLLSGQIMDDGITIDDVKILDIASGLEMIYVGNIKCTQGGENQFSKMWQDDNMISYDSMSEALGGWENLGSIDSTIKTSIDPVKGLITVNNQLIHSEEITLKFYDSLLDNVPRNDIEIKTGSLVFTGTISVVGNELVAWFEHPVHGYTYRVIKENEKINFNLTKEIKIIDSNMTTYQFLDPMMTMMMNSTISHNFIEVALYGKDSGFSYMRFIHKDKGYSIDCQDFTDSQVSEDGRFMFVVAEYLLHDYFSVQIVNLETDVIEYRVDEFSDHFMNGQYRYREMIWHDDTSLYLLYDNALENISGQEMMLKRIDGKWELLERD